MTQAISLSVNKRASAESVNIMRKGGDVPGVIYGNKTENQSIKCKMKDLHGVYMKAGENTLVEVDVEGKKIPALIHSISFEPVSGSYEHVDFYAVDMSKKVTTHVPVVFEGESPAVKGLGGIFVTVHDRVTVTCLPSDIPHHFVVKLDSLANFRDSIMMSSLVMPSGVTLDESPETVIVTVQEPRAEEVAPVVAAPVEGEAATAEGATPAEGAAAAPGAAPGAKTDDKAAPKKEEKKKEEKKK